jgi:hypothetical protein
MGEVVRFPVRLRPIQPITAEQIEIRDALILTLGACQDCGGSGWKVRPKNLRLSHFDDFTMVPCLCGGDDESRVDPDEPDYPGAA